jgi:signal transduction histidine kinase
MYVKSNLYLIFKEAVNNLVKYAQCQHAMLEFSISKNNLILSISDDGVGFNQDELTHKGGLMNMQYRATEIHAQMQIQSAPGAGTCIKLLLHL